MPNLCAASAQCVRVCMPAVLGSGFSYKGLHAQEKVATAHTGRTPGPRWLWVSAQPDQQASVCLLSRENTPKGNMLLRADMCPFRAGWRGSC